MGWFGRHLRNKLLAGVLAAIPLGVLVYGFSWIESHTQPLLEPYLGVRVPGLPVLVALLGVYLLGVVVTSFVGGLALRLLDHVLERLPGFRLLYNAWKDVVLLPKDRPGTFHQVVLVPQAGAGTLALGFTSGEPLPGEPPSWCVFLPNVPNPLTGRLVVVPRAQCVPLKLSVVEAFKILLSTGSYLPGDLRAGPVPPAGGQAAAP
jgi:uncharacterized membrane protein